MSGIFAALMGACNNGMLSALMAVGNSGGGNFGFVSGVYGTLTPATFNDHGGTSATVPIWNWDNTAVGSVGFRITGVSRANTDTTFISISIGGRVLTRASAIYTANDGSGHTLWSWSTNTSAYPISGTIPVTVS